MKLKSENEVAPRSTTRDDVERRRRKAMKLTVFIGGDERRAHHTLCELALKTLREMNITGATVEKGVMGYGINRTIHSTLNEVTMENLPIVIEAVDDGERLRVAAERIAEILGQHGLVQLQPTTVILKRKGERADA